MGYAWCMGFYFEPDPPAPSPREYGAKLKDSRWVSKARLIKERAGNRCEDCGILGTSLEAHHCWYQYGLEPWQYPLDAFRALCPPCHEARKPIEQRSRTQMARFSGPEVEQIRTAVANLFHWYDRKAVRAFLESCGPDDEAMTQALTYLRARKTEPGAS